MPDKHLNAVRSHLSLCRKLLNFRLIEAEQLPVGILIRNNRIKHTQTMLGLLSVLRGMAAHDPLNWWDNDDEVPF